ncbi:MAG TPA: PEGA domain-containing protein, partial [bacterium]|nr:PEGA domain-containing protein [bacterium]
PSPKGAPTAAPGATPATAKGTPGAPARIPAAVPQQSVAIYVYPDDANAGGMAARTAESIARRAQSEGWKTLNDPRVPELLERSPDDLARTADALSTARAAYKEALEENGRLRLDAAQADLQKSKESLLDAAAAPDYVALRQVHLYLGVVALNLGQQDQAMAQLRSVAFLAPNLALNKDLYAPSILDAFAAAKASLATSAKGALRIEVDGAKNALVIFDGVSRGTAPKTLTDLPEGEHYLEVRAPGASPQLLAVSVFPSMETPTIVTMRSAGASLRQSWARDGAEAGAVALARIVDADRIVLGSVRSTVTGVNAYQVRAAAFDVSLARKIQYAETGATKDPGANEPRLQKLATQLFKKSLTQPSAGSISSYAALLATRDRFLDRDSTLLTAELGYARQDHVFDAHGHYVSGTKDADPGNGERGFKLYTEERMTMHVRYGVKDVIALVVDVPVIAKTLTFRENGADTKATASGLGDVVAGLDIRLPRYESPRLALLYLAARAKLPSGASATPGFIHNYDRLLLGTGQFDLYGGVGGVIAMGDDNRADFEVGYTSRLPGRVNWSDNDGSPHYVNIGDEEHVHVDGARQVTRFFAAEADLDFTHRHATQHLRDPITEEDKAREMYLVNLALTGRMQVSESSEAGISLQHPVWGKITKTLFPVDVTGPHVSAWYSLRF